MSLQPKHGTLVLYDSENIKVPIQKAGKSKYIIPRVNMKSLTESIRKRFHDTHYNFISFGKKYHKGDVERNKGILKFNETLTSLGYSIVEKIVSLNKNIVIEDGVKKLHYYEECDMDGEIIHTIHTIGKLYSRVIMVSGDNDMKCALDYIRDVYGVEVWIIAHAENLSNSYKEENNTIELHKLLNKEKHANSRRTKA